MRSGVLFILLSSLFIVPGPYTATAQNKRGSIPFSVGAPKGLVDVYVSSLSSGEKPSPEGFIRTCCSALGAKHRSRRSVGSEQSLHRVIKSCDVTALVLCLGLGSAHKREPKVSARRVISSQSGAGYTAESSPALAAPTQVYEPISVVVYPLGPVPTSGPMPEPSAVPLPEATPEEDW
jgi:hypothetical protein